MITLSPTKPSARDEIADAIARASRDPIAARRRERLEQCADLFIPEVPKRLSANTVSKLIGAAVARTMKGD